MAEIKEDEIDYKGFLLDKKEDPSNVEDENEEDEESNKEASEEKSKVVAEEKKAAKVEEKKTEEKKEVAKVEDTTEDDELDFAPLAKELFEGLGVEWDDEYLKESNTLEGFIALAKELVEENSVPQYSSVISQQFDEFIGKGGDPKKFAELYIDKPDYTKFKLETIAEQKLIVKEHFKRTAPKMSDARIDKTIEAMVIDKEIEEEAKKSLKELQELDEAERKEAKAKLDEAQKAAALKAKQESDRINALIDKGGIDELGFELDKKTREAFKAFLFNTDSTGKTAYQKKAEKTPNLHYRLAYLAFADILDEKALGTEGRTKAIDKVKKTVSIFNQKKQAAGGTGNEKQKQQVADLGNDYSFFKLSKN